MNLSSRRQLFWFPVACRVNSYVWQANTSTAFIYFLAAKASEWYCFSERLNRFLGSSWTGSSLSVPKIESMMLQMESRSNASFLQPLMTASFGISCKCWFSVHDYPSWCFPHVKWLWWWCARCWSSVAVVTAAIHITPNPSRLVSVRALSAHHRS